MSTKLLKEINVKFPKTDKKLEKSYQSCTKRKKFIELPNKLGFFSKDHLCAVIALKKENLIPEKIYKELGKIYERFSDIFGFAIIFEARKLSQYDTEKWKELTEKDAKIIKNFAQKYVSSVEGACQ